MLFRIAKLLHFSQKTLVRYRFFDCMAEREQQNSPYTIIYMADEVRISAFYSFKRLFSSLFFMERSGSLMKRRLAKIKRRKNYFKRRFIHAQTAFRFMFMNLRENPHSFFPSLGEKKSLNAVKFPNKILSLQLQKHVYL